MSAGKYFGFPRPLRVPRGRGDSRVGESPPMRVRPAKGELARVVPDSLRSWARMPRGVHRGEARGHWKCHEGLGLGV